MAKMKVSFNVGKGGVGKTTTTVSLALALAKKGRVAVVDMDGGKAHSVARVLEINTIRWHINVFRNTGIDNLSLAIVDKIKFKSIEQMKKENKSVVEYMKQFIGDYGLIAFCDMVTTFFGVPTDVASTSNFLTLIRLYHDALEEGYDYLVIDVEPTAGLERLLNNTEVISRSLGNLKKNRIKIAFIERVWKEIGAFLNSAYIRTDIGKYTQRMLAVAKAIKAANFTVITTPESSPVDQVFGVIELVESFGGKVSGFVLNNVRLEEGQTQRQISRIVSHANGRPVVQIMHSQVLCDDEMSGRLEALEAVGKLLAVLP